MGRFRHTLTGVVVSVDDSKDDRYTGNALYESADKPAPKKSPAKKASASKSDK